MRARILLIAILLPLSLANAAVLECPTNAPAAWKVGKARLERARVLGYLPGDQLDEQSLPDGPPDKEWQRKGRLYQSWNVKAGAPPMVYQVDCLYAGTRRFLRFNADKAAECVGTWKVKGEGLVPGTLDFSCH